MRYYVRRLAFSVSGVLGDDGVPGVSWRVRSERADPGDIQRSVIGLICPMGPIGPMAYGANGPYERGRTALNP